MLIRNLLGFTLIVILSSGQPCAAEPVCRVSFSWDKHTPITITRAARWYPADVDSLSCMIPGERLAFQVQSTDQDLLKHHCQNECTPAGGDHYHAFPDKVRTRWSVQGGGTLQQIEGETVFYELASGAGTATLTYRLDTPGDKAIDDVEVSGSLEITTAARGNTGCLEVTIVPTMPNNPQYGTEIQNTDAPLCNHVGPNWEVETAIAGSVTTSNPLCPRATVLLAANVTDSDKLKLGCASSTCGDSDLEDSLSDVLQVTWDDGGAGGTFPLGTTGMQVIYTAPDDVMMVNFTAVVDDSGSQFNDNAHRIPMAKNSRQLFNLTAVNNVHGDSQFAQNVTVGKKFLIQPQWSPANSDVRRVRYKTQIGGPTGDLDFKKCTTSQMSTRDAALKFKTTPDDDVLEVSWREHSHIHGDALMDVKAWAMACGNACYCEDWAWEASNFGTSADYDEYNLYFDKKDERDDGRVENLATVRAHDNWGDYTDLGSGHVAAWFLHWSTDTYGTSTYQHNQAGTPVVKYGGSRPPWLGNYNFNTREVSLSDKAAGSSHRRAFRGKRSQWWGTSNDKWYRANTTRQRGYDLVGHQLATKVYLHEQAHYQSIFANWQAGGAWRTALTDFGQRSTTETANGSWVLPASNRITTTLAAVGNYRGRRVVGQDRTQKFNVNIELRENPQQPNTVTRTLTVNDAWFTLPRGLNRNSTRVAGGFEMFTATERWRFLGVTLTQFTRPNDPDDDFLPNAIEDRIGTFWNDVNNAGTHSGHKRFRPRSGVARHNYRADQEYWADHRVIGQGTPVAGLTNDEWATIVNPGNHDRDWANPGAQSNPVAQ